MAPSVGVKPDYSHQGEGILVEGVVRGTPAAKAGLKKGDRLVAVAGKPIKDAASFLALTRTIKPGEKIELTVVRDGKEERLAVQLTQPPAPPADVRFGLRLDLNDTRDGILVRSVADNGPAAKAGIRAGDRILRIAGEATRDPISYLNVLRDLEPGAKVDVTVMRSGKEETVKVQTATPRPRPAPPTARFGMTPDFNDDKEGVLVSRVREGSPAEEVGLKPGDRIVAVGGKPVKDVRAYVEVLVGLREGEKVEMTIRRAGKTLKLSVVLK